MPIKKLEVFHRPMQKHIFNSSRRSRLISPVNCEQIGKTTDLHHDGWPTFDPGKIQAATFELVIQVNGKVRERLRSHVIFRNRSSSTFVGDRTKWLTKRTKASMYMPGKLSIVV